MSFWFGAPVLFLAISFHCGAHSVLRYQADLTVDQVVGESPMPSESFTGSATFLFEPDEEVGSPRLTYYISVEGLDLDGSLTPEDPVDDVSAIRIRIGDPGVNGPHALNVFGLVDGAIREDDANLLVVPSIQEASGIWTDADETLTGEGGSRLPVDSIALSDAVQDLLAGRLYVEVTTAQNPEGALRGQMAPSPSAVDLKWFEGVGFQFTFNVYSPRVLRIESSEGFDPWKPVTNLVATNSIVRSIDLEAASHSQRFYRVTELYFVHPSITQQPQDQTVAAGEPVFFEVEAEGVPDPAIQWLFNGEPIEGESGLELSIQSVQSADAGEYQAMVSNASGSVLSEPANLILVE